MKKLYLLFVLLLVGLTCTKNPSGPKVLKSTIVYLPFWNEVFLLDGSKDQIVDSIKFDFYISDLNLSPNQKVLYLQKDYPDTGVIAEIDLDSRKIIYEGKNSSLFITPDGQYLISTLGGLRLITAKTHEIVYQNPVEVTGKPTFDSRLPVFYIAMRDKRILLFDYQKLQIIKFLNALLDKTIPPIFDILYSEIDNKLYFSTQCYYSIIDTSYSSYFGSIDAKRDLIIPLDKLSSYWSGGNLYNSSATQKIYVFSGCCLCVVIPESYPYNLFGFSVNTQKMVSELGLSSWRFERSGFQILEGGEKAYSIHSWYGYISIVDLVQNKIVGTIPIPYDEIPLSQARF